MTLMINNNGLIGDRESCNHCFRDVVQNGNGVSRKRRIGATERGTGAV